MPPKIVLKRVSEVEKYLYNVKAQAPMTACGSFCRDHRV